MQTQRLAQLAFATLGLGVALAGDVSAGDSAPHGRGIERDDAVTSVFKLLGKNAIWQPLERVAMAGWQTFHTQGLVKIGEAFYVTSVEVLDPRVSNGTATDALYDFSIDRSAGSGRAWLFKFDAAGNLLGKTELTDG